MKIERAADHDLVTLELTENIGEALKMLDGSGVRRDEEGVPVISIKVSGRRFELRLVEVL